MWINIPPCLRARKRGRQIERRERWRRKGQQTALRSTQHILYTSILNNSQKHLRRTEIIQTNPRKNLPEIIHHYPSETGGLFYDSKARGRKMKTLSKSGFINNSNLTQTEFNHTYISQTKAGCICHQAALSLACETPHTGTEVRGSGNIVPETVE